MGSFIPSLKINMQEEQLVTEQRFIMSSIIDLPIANE